MEEATAMESPYEMNNFTLEDRKELIKQSVVMEQQGKEIHDLKVQIRESNLRWDIEKESVKKDSQAIDKEIELRLRKLEDTSTKLTTTIKTMLWIGGFIITAVQAILELSIHIFAGKP